MVAGRLSNDESLFKLLELVSISAQATYKVYKLFCKLLGKIISTLAIQTS
jgi:hypothetical protein